MCHHLFHCGAGNGSFNVSYDGKFRLCSSLWAEGTTYDLRSQRREFLDSCRRCEIVNLCLWCPAHAHLETGMLDGTTPDFCAAAHRRAEELRAAVSAP